MKRRRFLEAAGIAAGAALVAACASNTTTINAGGDMIRGSGKVIQESRPIQDVKTIEVGGSARLEVVFDGPESLTVEAEDNIMPLLTSEVRNGTLVLGLKPNTSITTNKGYTFKVTVPRVLDLLKMTGSSSARVAGVKGGGKAAFQLEGSSKANVAQLETDSVEVSLRGSSELTLSSGGARDQQVKVFDSSSYVADKFQTATGTVTASNSGKAVVSVTETLNATAENSASVKYAGSPTVSKDVKDSGKVEPR